MSDIRVEVVLALPRRHASVAVLLPEGATLAEAVRASGLPVDGIVGHAVFGERAEPATPLRDGDRVELLRPLQADPKEARRRRAASQRTPG
jgi:putative ubiquitin-RnfH superfamily antitoxin RatB of RatAB toxin-antitoxin module